MKKFIVVLLFGLLASASVSFETPQSIIKFLDEKNEEFQPKPSHMEKVVLMFSDTRSNKSSLSQFLAPKSSDSDATYYNEEETEIESSTDKSGSRKLERISVIPELTYVENFKTAYYDLPGFQDSRTPEQEVTALYLINKLLESVKSLKIVLVVNMSSVKKGLIPSTFLDFIRKVTKLLKNIDAYEDGIAMVLTEVVNTYRTVEGQSQLKSDTEVIGEIAQYLETEKDNIYEQNKLSVLSENERILNHEIIKLFNTLLKKYITQKYSRIRILRSPENLDQREKKDLLPAKERKIKTMVNRTLKFVSKKNEIEFGSIISPTSSVDVKALTNQILIENVLNCVEKICEEVAQYYSKVFLQKLEFDDIDNTFKEARNRIEKFEFSDPLVFCTNFTERTHQIAEESSIIDLQKYIHYIEFQLKEHPIQLNTPDGYSYKILITLSNILFQYDTAKEKKLRNLITEEIPSVINFVSNEIDRYYIKLENRSTDLYILRNELLSDFNKLSDVNLSNLQSLANVIDHSKITISIESMTNLTDVIQKTNRASVYEMQYEIMIQRTNERWKETLRKLKEAESWYTFLITLHIDMTELQHKQHKNVVNKMEGIVKKSETENIPVEKTGLKLLRQFTGEQYATLYDNLKDLHLSHDRRKALISVITSLLKKATISCDESSNMTVTGNVVKISDITSDTTCWPKAQFIEIFALDSVIIDTNMELFNKTFQMAIISPVWTIVKKSKIVMKGEPGKSKDDARNALESIESSYKGYDGKAGNPGKPGGNFLGIGREFYNGNYLRIISQGGDGGPGQNGGKGSKGIDARPPSLTADQRKDFDSCLGYWSQISTSLESCVYEICEKRKYRCLGSNLRVNVTIEGIPGSNGGDGGKGGRGGLGGKPGNINVIALDKSSYITNVPRQGNRGPAGSGGSGGAPAIKSKILEVWFRSLYELNSGCQFYCRYWSVNPDIKNDHHMTEHGKKGRNGSSSDKRKKPIPARNYDRASHTINRYKNYVRENLAHNFRESKLREYLTQIDNNVKIRNLYDVLGFMDELISLESHYSRVQTKQFFMPFLDSILDRISDYVEQHKTLSPVDKVIFNYMYGAVTSKLFNLENKMDRRTVYNLDDFLSLVKEEIDELKKKKKTDIEAIIKYQNEYNQLINEKKTDAENLGVDQILLDIEDIFNDIDQNVITLRDESIAKQRDTNKNIIDNDNIIEDLRIAMKTRLTVAPIKLMASVITFFGPRGAAVRTVIATTTSIYESTTIKNDRELEDREPLSPEFKKSVIKMKRQLNNDLALLKSQVNAIKNITDEYLDTSQHSIDSTEKFRFENVQKKINLCWKQLNDTENKSYDDMNMPSINEIKREVKMIVQNIKPLLDNGEGNERRFKRSSGSSFKKVVGKIEAIADSADMPVEIFETIKDNEKVLRKASKISIELKKEMQTLKDYEQLILKKVLPEVKFMKENIENFRNFAGNSHAILNIKKWRIKTLLIDLASLFRQMSTDFSVGDEFLDCVTKIETGVSALIDIYGSIDSYTGSQKLARLVADMKIPKSLGIEIKDTELSTKLAKLQKITYSNIVLDKYQLVMRGVKQHYFPIVEELLQNHEIPESLQMVNTDMVTDQVITHVSNIRKILLENKVLSQKYGSEILSDVEFDSISFQERPFYVWKYNTIKKEVKKLLKGQKVDLIADIENGIDKNAVKFNQIGISLQLTTASKKKKEKFEEKFRTTKIFMSMSGNNYYRCNDRIYNMPLNEVVKFEFLLTKDLFGKYESPSANTKTIRENRAFYSPFAKWSIQLIGDNVSGLSEFQNESMDLQLIGHGSCMKKGDYASELCNDELDKHFTLDRIEKHV